MKGNSIRKCAIIHTKINSYNSIHSEPHSQIFLDSRAELGYLIEVGLGKVPLPSSRDSIT